MTKINSVADLEAKSAACTKCLEDKLKGQDDKRHIVLCGGTGCLSSNSKEIMEKFKALKEAGIDESRIKTSAHGSAENPYDGEDMKLNRVCICVAK